MAEVTADAILDLGINATGLEKGLRRAGSSMDHIMAKSDEVIDKNEKLMASFRKFGSAIVAGMGGAAVIGFYKNAIDAASQAEDLDRRFHAVFSNIGDEADKTVTQLMKGVNRTTGTIQQMLVTNADVMTSLGMNQTAALKYASSLSELSTKLAVVRGESEATISDAFKMALMGNTRSLKQLGIQADDTAIKQEILAQKMKGTIFATEQETRIAALLNIIYKQSANSIAAYDKIVGGYGNTLTVLKDQYGELKEGIGAAFIEPAAKLLSSINGILKAFNELDEGTKTSLVRLSAFGIGVGGLAAAYQIASAAVSAYTAIKNISDSVTTVGAIKSTSAIALETDAISSQNIAINYSLESILAREGVLRGFILTEKQASIVVNTMSVTIDAQNVAGGINAKILDYLVFLARANATAQNMQTAAIAQTTAFLEYQNLALTKNITLHNGAITALGKNIMPRQILTNTNNVLTVATESQNIALTQNTILRQTSIPVVSNRIAMLQLEDAATKKLTASIETQNAFLAKQKAMAAMPALQTITSSSGSVGTQAITAASAMGGGRLASMGTAMGGAAVLIPATLLNIGAGIYEMADNLREGKKQWDLGWNGLYSTFDTIAEIFSYGQRKLADAIGVTNISKIIGNSIGEWWGGSYNPDKDEFVKKTREKYASQEAIWKAQEEEEQKRTKQEERWTLEAKQKQEYDAFYTNINAEMRKKLNYEGMSTFEKQRSLITDLDNIRESLKTALSRNDYESAQKLAKEEVKLQMEINPLQLKLKDEAQDALKSYQDAQDSQYAFLYQTVPHDTIRQQMARKRFSESYKNYSMVGTDEERKDALQKAKESFEQMSSGNTDHPAFAMGKQTMGAAIEGGTVQARALATRTWDTEQKQFQTDVRNELKLLRELFEKEVGYAKTTADNAKVYANVSN